MSLANDVLATGADDESEVTWTKLPYHRAALRWRELKKVVPTQMGLQDVSRDE